MKKLIRSRATGKFLTARGEWTASLNKAADLAKQGAVHEARTKFKLPDDAEVYYAFGESKPSQYDVSVLIWWGQRVSGRDSVMLNLFGSTPHKAPAPAAAHIDRCCLVRENDRDTQGRE